MRTRLWKTQRTSIEDHGKTLRKRSVAAWMEILKWIARCNNDPRATRLRFSVVVLSYVHKVVDLCSILWLVRNKDC